VNNPLGRDGVCQDPILEFSALHADAIQQNPSANIFFLFHLLTKQYGVPKGRRPYPPVTCEFSCAIFTVIYNKIHPPPLSTCVAIVTHPKNWRLHHSPFPMPEIFQTLDRLIAGYHIVTDLFRSSLPRDLGICHPHPVQAHKEMQAKVVPRYLLLRFQWKND
jgi:hypothetical protein